MNLTPALLSELNLQDIKQLVEVEKSPHQFQRDSREAFDNAVRQGLDPDAFMYMYSTAQQDYFKHVNTREYVSYDGVTIPERLTFTILQNVLMPGRSN